MTDPSRLDALGARRHRPRSVAIGAAGAAGAALLLCVVAPSCGSDTPLFPSSSSSGSGSGSGGSGGSGGAAGAGGASGSTSGSGAGGAMPTLVHVLTQHNDNAHTGANLGETILTPSNVNVTQFGLLFKRPVDDQIYAQPLIVPGVTIPGKGKHNVVYAATMGDSVYAFDADDPKATAPLWHASFADAASGVTPVFHTDVGQACGTYQDISGNIGVLSTPVIDEATGTLYAVAKTKEKGATQVYRLHALDITTGAERPNSPVVLQATVPGTGDGSSGGMLAFDASIENQRAGLTLANGLVYIGFASYCDTGPYHGWMLAYDASSLAQKAAYAVTPDGWAGGVWMSGAGPSVDADGNVYVISGNGTFTGDVAGGQDFGCSFLKLSPTLKLLDWFTPYNFDDLNAGDLDLGSSGALLLPGSNLVVGGGKNGVLYVLDRGGLGHFNKGGDTQIVQSFSVTAAHVHGAPIAWDLPSGPMIYVWGESDYLRSYRLTGGKLQKVGQSAKPAPTGMPGGMLSLSANGTTPGTGIVWATHPLIGDANQAVRPGILQAFDAADLTKVLWDSQQDAARDDFGNFAKFCPPTIANGKVYLATFSNQLMVYGLGAFNDPCANGKQDPGEMGVDCGGACPACKPNVVPCPGAGAIAVGDSYTCDLGAVHTITAGGISVGCNDGETATFSLAFDAPGQVNEVAGCNTSFPLNNIVSRYITLTMVAGGGMDQNISFECCGSGGWSITYQ